MLLGEIVIQAVGRRKLNSSESFGLSLLPLCCRNAVAIAKV